MQHHNERTINVVQQYNARTINECQSADPHLATSLEGSYVANRGKHPQSDVVEENMVTEICLSAAMPVWKLKVDTGNAFSNHQA